jgi:hypothetical protein
MLIQRRMNRRPKVTRTILGFCAVAFQLCLTAQDDNGNIHVTWLLHNHQPIYYPDKCSYRDHYQNVWDTIQAQSAGQTEPTDVSLQGVFNDDNRRHVYQDYPQGAVQSINWLTDAGIQLNMSGALMENIQSLASAGQYGYYNGWNNLNATTRTWLTSGGKPRMDLVNFTYHHALAALVTDATLKMELAIHQRQMEIFWNISGSNPPISNGYFPTENCFSERLIPILHSMGITWTVISGTHLTRTCPDAPFVFGSGGEMCEPPNKADQINPAQGTDSYQTRTIARGCSPMWTAPFSFQAHVARYVDPATGNATMITVVPSDQAMSWEDGYESWNLTTFTNNGTSSLQPRNDPTHPGIVLLCHDGDNAFANGSTYWQQSINSIASQANTAGYQVTTIQQFLAAYQPSDIVHVEDGGWVFADGDFGSPSYVNWNWPPSYSNASTNYKNVIDPSQGTSPKSDFWRCILVTENRVRTAQQISGITPRVDQVRDPGSYSPNPATNAVELGWHYYLAGLDSGFVYYGAADDAKRCVVSQQNVVREIDTTVNNNLSQDTTPPSVFLPQRFPWNPGGKNYGVQYNYVLSTAPDTDFWIWTYAYDASGLANVTLKYRSNGNTGAPTQDEFKTYVGGPDTGAWQSVNMTQRVSPSTLALTPQYQADYYYTKITGLSDTYVDYYVTATDNKGNTYNSPIQHVYVAVNNNPTKPAAPTNLSATAVSSTQINLTWTASNGASSYIIQRNSSPLGTSSTAAYNDTGLNPSTTYTYTVIAHNSAGDSPASATAIATTFTPPPIPTTPIDLTAIGASPTQINLAWNAVSGATSFIVKRNGAQVGTPSSTNFCDTGLVTSTAYSYTVAASNIAGTSPDSASVSANTLAASVPFVMNGTADSMGYLLSTPGTTMTLYAAVRGSKLYVATWSPSDKSAGGTGVNDHFIIVTDQLLPSASQAAIPSWSKAGLTAVSSGKPFLGGESTNNYVDWSNAGASAVCAKSSDTLGQMEGTLDLIEAFGSIPQTIYIAAVAYATADGGVLAGQAPAGDGNGNLDPNEFLAISVPAFSLLDRNADGKFDRLDPALDFKAQISCNSNGWPVITWPSVPGKSYQVEYRNDLGSTWTIFTSQDATAGQLILSTSPDDAGQTRRFYRVRVLP